VALSAVARVPASAREPVQRNGLSLLFDATRCIGCQSCMAACQWANRLPPDRPAENAPYHSPQSLSARAKTLVVRTSVDPPRFYKLQCMHCLEPACTSVCILGALHKQADGVVAYDPDLCIGCRYCQIACPFNVPRFEWDDPTPRIVKCELCRDRHDGEGPACCEVCPRRATLCGPREELLAEAKRRIAEQPGRYVDHVYGEHEAGGTQVLVLSDLRFEETSLPQLSSEPAARLSETVQHGIYKGFVAPVALYGALAAVLWRNRRLEAGADLQRKEDAP